MAAVVKSGTCGKVAARDEAGRSQRRGICTERINFKAAAQARLVNLCAAWDWMIVRVVTYIDNQFCLNRFIRSIIMSGNRAR